MGLKDSIFKYYSCLSGSILYCKLNFAYLNFCHLIHFMTLACFWYEFRFLHLLE